MLRLLVSTGEVSGDLQGSLLIKALHEEAQRRQLDLEIVALGGERMERAGAALLANTTRMGAIGLLEAIPFYRQALRLDPTHPEAGGNLASVLLELGRVEEAMPVLRASLEQLLQLRREAGATAATRPLPTIWASLLMFGHYQPGADPAELGREARRWGEAACARARSQLPPAMRGATHA
jgi:tetratricopeptide (TPR) repeat protein